MALPVDRNISTPRLDTEADPASPTTAVEPDCSSPTTSRWFLLAAAESAGDADDLVGIGDSGEGSPQLVPSCTIHPEGVAEERIIIKEQNSWPHR